MTANPGTPTYQSRPDTGLKEHERYTFMGWITKKDFINQNSGNPTIIDLSAIYVNQGTISELYPYYEVEDATKVASNIDFFLFKEETINFSQVYFTHENSAETTDRTISLPNEYVIEVKPEYRAFLSGKITLPSKDKNGRPVTAIGKLSDGSNGVTHVYFMPDTQVKVLGHVDHVISGFYGLSNLTTVYFPTGVTTLKYIGNMCFANLEKLEKIINLPDSIEHIDNMAFNWCTSLEFIKLPTSLKYVGSAGFLGCSKMSIEVLPHGYTQILPQTFNYCDKVKVGHFGNSTGGAATAIDNNVTHIGDSAFEMNGNTIISEIYLHDSLTYIGRSSFNNYGTKKDFIIYNGSRGLVDNSNYDLYFGSRDLPTIIDTDSH